MDADGFALSASGLVKDGVDKDGSAVLVLLDELLSSSLLLDRDFIRSNLKLKAKMLGLSTGGSHDDGINIDWDTFLLGEFDSDGGRSIGDEILHLTSGDISIH